MTDCGEQRRDSVSNAVCGPHRGVARNRGCPRCGLILAIAAS